MSNLDQFAAFEEKFRLAGVSEAAVVAFRRAYEALLRDESGLIGEEEIAAVEGLPVWKGSGEGAGELGGLLDEVVVIKLNGGLGTSMGLQKAKSLLQVRDGVSFLDLIARQVVSLREASGSRVRLLLMNSFSTSKDTMEALRGVAGGAFADPGEVEMLQNQVPKVDAATLAPVSWPANPELEWCPPGHGDLYAALAGSGWLDRLLAEGVKYAFVSNSDNLGAVLEPGLVRYFAQSGAPFLMEVTRRTESDRKGGHLAVRRSDGQLLLREVAQCAPADLAAFQDISEHRYFNTNNLWLRLDVLRERLAAEGGSLPLPMIRNRKTVDPRDKNSPAVYQLEIAMGAAIESFPGAAAIEVSRERFTPVKTTADLLALRSDAYQISPDGCVQLVPARHGIPPVVELSDEYKLVDGLDALGVPSLVECNRLSISGLVHFQPGVHLAGSVAVTNPSDSVLNVAPGTYRDTTVTGAA